MAADQAAYFLGILNGPRDIAGMTECDGSIVTLGERDRECCGRYPAIAAWWEYVEFNAASLFQLDQWSHQRTVFQRGGEHSITLAKVTVEEGVEGIGSAGGKDRAMGWYSTDVGASVADLINLLGHDAACLAVPTAGTDAKVRKPGLYRFEYLWCLGEAGGGVIEVNHAPI